MPIELSFQVVRHSKKETTDLIFEAVNHAMKVHSELGRYLNEECYANALAARFGDRAKTEALVRVRHSDFTKDYFIDFVLDSALPLELKATTQIVSAHRSQLMQYLLFADMETGKVINFRPTSLQHDFVNNHRTLAQRQSFEIKNSTPIPHSHSGVFDNFTSILISLLKDIGTGLETSLYTEAIIHFSEGSKTVLQPTPVTYQDTIIGTQNLPILAEATSFKVTAPPQKKRSPSSKITLAVS